MNSKLNSLVSSALKVRSLNPQDPLQKSEAKRQQLNVSPPLERRGPAESCYCSSRVASIITDEVLVLLTVDHGSWIWFHRSSVLLWCLKQRSCRAHRSLRMFLWFFKTLFRFLRCLLPPKKPCCRTVVLRFWFWGPTGWRETSNTFVAAAFSLWEREVVMRRRRRRTPEVKHSRGNDGYKGVCEGFSKLGESTTYWTCLHYDDYSITFLFLENLNYTEGHCSVSAWALELPNSSSKLFN